MQQPKHRTILAEIGMSEEKVKQRMSFIGGSDANIIMGGDDEKIMALWKQKTGKEKSDDLSGVLPVVIGQYTEDLNAAWYERITGDLVENRNDRFVHGAIPFMAANVDGICQSGASIWEAKHVNQFSNFSDVLRRYTPQLHHNGYVYGSKIATLSAFIGTMDYEYVSVELDDMYTEVLLSSEDKFWRCVTQDIPPCDLKIEQVSIDFDDMIEKDMTGNNEWASQAAEYIENSAGAKKFEVAKKSLKEMVDSNVRKAFGHGVSISRAKNGNLTVRG